MQDDLVHRKAEIAKNAFIFAGAVFTIAACDGPDADYGLRGVKMLPDALPRSFHQEVYRVGSEAFVATAETVEMEAKLQRPGSMAECNSGWI